MFDAVLFDLDGTLTDPYEGITRSVQYALARYGINVEDRGPLAAFIGPPLNESFMKYYGFSEEESYRAVEVYREYFRPKGIFENELYPGTVTLLERLTDAGKEVILATSKPEIFAKQVIEHFNIAKYFSKVVGSELDGRRTDKAEVIKAALEGTDGPAVMVGDRMHDVAGANANGIPAIGVLWGYGSREELENAGAWKTVSDTDELLALIYE